MRTYLLIAGAVVVLLAIGWNVAAHRRVKRDLEALLGDPDPLTRAAAVRQLSTEGVERFCSTLSRMCDQEDNAEVIASMVAVISRNQSQPASNVELLRLRLWAADRMSRAETLPELVTPARPEVATRTQPVKEQAAHVDTERIKSTSTEERATVLVTGAGGPAGVAVIRHLTAGGTRVVAVDADASAVGLRLAPESAKVPRSDDPAFVEAICKVAIRNGAVAIVATVAEELVVLSEGIEQLRDAGVASWLPKPWSVEQCVDKWLFYRLMTSKGISVPPTDRGFARNVPPPWIVKPRFGRGSRDVFYVDEPLGLTYALHQVADPLVQTRVVGREFTVDVLAEDGLVLGAVPRWRVETKAGISTKGVTFKDPGLVDEVGEVIAVLELSGPANVQGFVTHEDLVVFTEVNPRFSGGLPLSLAAGSDLVGQYLNGVMGRPIDVDALGFRAEVSMMRHFMEVFEG